MKYTSILNDVLNPKPVTSTLPTPRPVQIIGPNGEIQIVWIQVN